MKSIKEERERIEKKLKKWKSALSELRKNCAHPNISEQHSGDTGNLCLQDDCYWTDYECPDCGKIWRDCSKK